MRYQVSTLSQAGFFPLLLFAEGIDIYVLKLIMRKSTSIHSEFNSVIIILSIWIFGVVRKNPDSWRPVIVAAITLSAFILSRQIFSDEKKMFASNKVKRNLFDWTFWKRYYFSAIALILSTVALALENKVT